jgi:glycosyltransferase involved in cell wall biosynthesis
MSGRFYPARHFTSQWSDTSIAIKMRMERRILDKTTHVIALTEQGRQEVRRYDYKGPITVIPNGADTERFRSNPKVAKDIDVLFSGRIELRKGSRPMVDLCKRLVSRRPTVKICIVGYGDDDEYVRRELLLLGANVTLAGKVPFEGMIDYYNRSTVYVSTSYYEGLPGTCLEAMAMELPAVVWNFPFYAGLVVERQTGFLAEPNDFDAMSHKILALLDDRAMAQEIGRRGRALLESNYSWRQLARDILLVLDNE